MINRLLKIKQFMTVTLAILLLRFENVSAQESVLVYSNTSPPDNAANVYGIVPMIEELKNTIPMKLVPGSQLFDSRTALASIGGGIADAGEVISSYSRSDLKHAVILNDLMYLGRNELVVNAAATETLLLNCPNCLTDYAERTPYSYRAQQPALMVCFVKMKLLILPKSRVKNLEQLAQVAAG